MIAPVRMGPEAWCGDGGDGSTAARCLALIELHAPRMMRAAGGAIQDEKRSWRKIGREDAANMVRLYRAGKSLDAVGAETGWSKTPIAKVLIRAGVAIRERPRRVRADVRAEVQRRLAAGQRRAAVARATGVSFHTVARYALEGDMKLSERAPSAGEK